MYEDWSLMDNATKERLGDFALHLVMSSVMNPEQVRRVVEDAAQDLNPDDETPRYLPVTQPAAPVAVVQTDVSAISHTTGADIVASLDDEVSSLYGDYGDDEVYEGTEEDYEENTYEETPHNTGTALQHEELVIPEQQTTPAVRPTQPLQQGVPQPITARVSNRVPASQRKRQTRVSQILLQGLGSNPNINGTPAAPQSQEPLPEPQRDCFGGYIPNGLLGNNTGAQGGASVGNTAAPVGNTGEQLTINQTQGGNALPQRDSLGGYIPSSLLNRGNPSVNPQPQGEQLTINQYQDGTRDLPPQQPSQPAPATVSDVQPEAPGISGQEGFGGATIGVSQPQNVQTIDPDTAQQPSQAVYANKLFLNATRKSDERNYVNPQNVGSVFENVKRSIQADETRTAWADLHYDPQPGRTTIDGKPFEFKFIQKNVGWGAELTDDFEKNFYLMKRRITESIRAEFGGFNRIREIVVQDSRLFINRIMYCPMIEPSYISRLPQDLQASMVNGNIAEFFDWSALKHMRSLFSLSIDTSYFYCTTVLDDLGVSRRGGVSTVFKCVPSLAIFSLAGETINRENLGTPQSHNIKETVRKQKKNIAIMDGFKLNVYGAGDYLQETCWASTKSYIDNRGNKNLFRFCGGLLLRGTAGVAATTGNAVVHTVGWGLKTLGSMIKAGMEPIEKSEHFTQ